MDIANIQLHAAREALGLTQQDVAKVTGVAARTIYRIESGTELVGFETLEKLRAHYQGLGVSLVMPRDAKKWALSFSREIAPAPASDTGSENLFDPVPGSVLKAARILSGMTQLELGLKAGLAHTTIRKLEKSSTHVRHHNAHTLQRTLEDIGLQFVKPAEKTGWLVRYREDSRDSSRFATS